MSLKNIKSMIIHAASESTAHGLPNIIKSENLFLKIIWIFFFIQSSQSEVAGSNTGSPTMHDPGALRDVCLFCVYHET